MRRITRLKREALDACKFRGHDMSRFWAWPHSYIAECKKCGRYVQVTENPLPNEIDIGGTAVGDNCK